MTGQTAPEFPIAGPLREPLLVAECLIVFATIEVVVLFFARYRRAKQNPEERAADLVYTLFFSSFGIMWAFFIAGDHFTTTPAARINFLLGGYIAMAVGAWLFVYFMEQRVFSRWRPFTLIFGLLLFVMVGAYFWDPFYAQTISMLFWCPFILILLAYLLQVKRNFHLGARIYGMFFLSFVATMVGFLGTIDAILDVTGSFVVRLVGDALQVVGLALLGRFFARIPGFTEFNWQAKTSSIFAFYTGGVLIFDHAFAREENRAPVQAQLMAGALESVKDFLKQTTAGDSEPVKQFTQDNAQILLEYGQYVTGVAVCTEELKSVRRLLARFVARVEMVFQDILPKWSGNETELAPIHDVFQGLVKLESVR